MTTIKSFFYMDLKPKDIVALVSLAFIFLFKWYGFDGVLDSMIALILGYYFAHRVTKMDKGI